MGDNEQKVELEIDGTTYLLYQETLDLLNTKNVVFDADFAGCIRENEKNVSADDPYCIKKLCEKELARRLLYQSDAYTIMVHDEYGTVLGMYDELWEALYNHRPGENIFFNFRGAFDQNIIPTSRQIIFYGCTITPKTAYLDKGTRFYVPFLNYFTEKVEQAVSGQRDKGRKKNLELALKSLCYGFKYEMRSEELKRQKHQQQVREASVSLEESLGKLFDAYTFDGKCRFRKVDELGYENSKGIYVIVYGKEKYIYVGQTRRTIKQRVCEHFTKPKSMFDALHCTDDVTAIYAMEMPAADDHILDSVEEDCIALAHGPYLANVLAGSSWDVVIDENYRPEDHTLSNISRRFSIE